MPRRGRLELAERAADAAAADDIVITIGTPSFSHFESDLRQVRAAVDDLLPLLRPGHALILRSTIAPGTTEFVAGYLEKRRGLKVGEDVFVAHAPERIAAGRFLEEISTLPCIIGGVGDASTERAASMFSVFGAPIVTTTPVQAELAKIWTNILRYATFALPNLLMMDCERYDANVFEVIDLINHDYPRGGIAMPGLTAGTCLRKDFVFSEERSNAPGMLLAVSRVSTRPCRCSWSRGSSGGWAACRRARSRCSGLTFKRDTDDERDSLSPKLIRLLERELADVAVCDPRAPTPTQPLADAVARRGRGDHRDQPLGVRDPRRACARSSRGASDDCLLVDPWNALGHRAGVRLHGGGRRDARHRGRGGMTVRRALITGITGQDGSYLAEFLLEQGYEVHGMVRRSSTEKFERIEHIRDRLDAAPGRPARSALAGRHAAGGTARTRSTTWPRCPTWPPPGSSRP